MLSIAARVPQDWGDPILVFHLGPPGVPGRLAATLAGLADPASASPRCSPPWVGWPDRRSAVFDTSPSCAGCRGAPPRGALAAHNRIFQTREAPCTGSSVSLAR